MSHRDPNVYLAPDVARCAPTRQCGRQMTCARYLAPIDQGAPLADFSVPSAQHPWYVVAAGHVCLHHYPVSQTRRPAPVRERTVHKPPKGIVFP